MQQHPRLWRHAVLPIVCNLVLTVLLLAGLIWGGVASYDWLLAQVPLESWWTWAQVLVRSVLLPVALVVVIAGFAIAAWILFQGILCGHFYSLLAREVEIQLGLNPADMREVPLWYQVTDAVRDLAFLSAIAIGCLLLNLVPVLGSIAALLIGGYFDAFVFGMEYLDYPQALRARGRRVQREFARQHRAVTLGLGASVTLLTFIPVLNSVLLTTAATGAVLLYRKLDPQAAAGTRSTVPTRA